jgi:hypothetical protein
MAMAAKRLTTVAVPLSMIPFGPATRNTSGSIGKNIARRFY